MGMYQCSKMSSILFANLLVFLLIVNGSDVNLEVNGALNFSSPLIGDVNGTNNSTEHKGGGISDSIIATQVKNEDQLEHPKEGVEKDFDKSNIGNSLEFKSQNHKVSGDSSNEELKDKDKESGTSGESRDEECDPSNMCIDEKKNLTACLRVPGNDSPDLSLLIQNKGTRPVNVTITAPAFIQLEETKVQLQPTEDKKVKVSLAYEGIDSLIILTTEDSRCTLDFRELIPPDSRAESRSGFKLRYLNNFTRTHFVIFLALTVFLLFGFAWMYFGLRKKDGYQAVEIELPISDVAITVSENTNDGGWDNSWDDHWDDEEAPKTPTLPATPNLSSKGLASRRLSKDGWKD